MPITTTILTNSDFLVNFDQQIMILNKTKNMISSNAFNNFQNLFAHNNAIHTHTGHTLINLHTCTIHSLI